MAASGRCSHQRPCFFTVVPTQSRWLGHVATLYIDKSPKAVDPPVQSGPAPPHAPLELQLAGPRSLGTCSFIELPTAMHAIREKAPISPHAAGRWAHVPVLLIDETHDTVSGADSTEASNTIPAGSINRVPTAPCRALTGTCAESNAAVRQNGKKHILEALP